MTTFSSIDELVSSIYYLGFLLDEFYFLSQRVERQGGYSATLFDIVFLEKKLASLFYLILRVVL